MNGERKYIIIKIIAPEDFLGCPHDPDWRIEMLTKNSEELYEPVEEEV